MNPYPLAIIAVACGVIAAALTLTCRNFGAILPAVVSGLGLLSLIALKVQIDREVRGEGEGLIQIEFTWAFWAAVLLYATSGVLNAREFSNRSFMPPPLPEPSQ